MKMSLSYKFVTIFIFFHVVRGEQNMFDRGNAVPRPMVSEECRKRGICSEVKNYPIELAKGLIRELKESGAIFPITEVVKEDNFLTGEYPKITSRMDKDGYDEAEEPKETPLCNCTKTIEHPTFARNRNSKWKPILNDPEEPIQTVTVVQCTSENSRCSEKIKFMSNYECVCVQRWILKELYYIDENKKPAVEYFKIPACCSSKLHHIDN